MRAARLASVALVLLFLLSLALVPDSTAVTRQKPAAGNDVSTGPKPRAKSRDFPRHPLPKVQVFEDARPDPDAPPHPFTAYLAARTGALSKLDAVTDLNYTDTPLAVMVSAISDAIGVPIHIECPAKEAEKKISFAVRDLKARWTLKLLVQQYDCRLTVSGTGEIWIVSNEEGTPPHEPSFMADLRAQVEMSGLLIEERRLPAHPEAEEALQTALRNTLVTFNFSQTPLPDVAAWLNEHARISVMLDGAHLYGELAATPVTADMTKGTVEEALKTCFGEGPIGWYTKDGVVMLTTRDHIEFIAYDLERRTELGKLLRQAQAELLRRTVDFGAENLAIRDVAELLGKALGVPVQVDPGTWSRAARYSFEPGPRPASEIVELLHKGAPVMIAYRDETLWFLSPEGMNLP